MKQTVEEISLCPNCNCMTKTINGNCGKCGISKNTVEERFDKQFVDFQADGTNWGAGLYLNEKIRPEDIKVFIQQELKANDDAWKERLDKVIENNKNPDWDTYDYDGVASDLINLLKEKK